MKWLKIEREIEKWGAWGGAVKHFNTVEMPEGALSWSWQSWHKRDPILRTYGPLKYLSLSHYSLTKLI